MNLKMLIYCTKAKGKNYYLRKLPNGRYCLSRDKGESLNGKIVAEFDGEVSTITMFFSHWVHAVGYYTERKEPYRFFSYGDLLKASCLNDNEIYNYLDCKDGYAIHIKNLNVFDKPKELSDFYKSTNEITFEPPLPLIKAPQNMCYAYDKYGNKYFVISVHPEWLCLILNGLKDVELRKKVLKEML